MEMPFFLKLLVMGVFFVLFVHLLQLDGMQIGLKFLNHHDDVLKPKRAKEQLQCCEHAIDISVYRLTNVFEQEKWVISVVVDCKLTTQNSQCLIKCRWKTKSRNHPHTENRNELKKTNFPIPCAKPSFVSAPHYYWTSSRTSRAPRVPFSSLFLSVRTAHRN